MSQQSPAPNANLMPFRGVNAQQTFIPAQSFSLLDNCKFRVRTMEEANALSSFTSRMFRDPDRVRPGLYELLLNGLEHGCFGIGFDLKTRLLENHTWHTEMARRQSLPENRKKHVDLVIARKPEGIVVIVTDPGNGFDWRSWASVDPARAGDIHGRGIAKARGLSFDKLTYNDKGNQALALSKDAPEMVW